MSRLSNTAKTIALLGGMFALNSMDAAYAQTQPAEKQSPPFTKTEQMVATGTVSRFVDGEEKESLVVVLGRDTLVVQPDPKGDAHLVMGARGVNAEGKPRVELEVYTDSTRFVMKDPEKPFNSLFEEGVSLNRHSKEKHGSIAWTHLQSNKNTMANQNTEQPPIEELQAFGVLDIQNPGDTTYITHIIVVDPQSEIQVLKKNEEGDHWVFEMMNEHGDFELHFLQKEGKQHSKITLLNPLGIKAVTVSAEKYDFDQHGVFGMQWLGMKPGIEGTLPVEPAPTRKESPNPL